MIMNQWFYTDFYTENKIASKMNLVNISDLEDSFSSQISEFLLNKILINENKCDYSKINQVGCMLFMKYFKIINWWFKKVVIAKNNFIRVNNCDNILGFDTVWNILSCTSNETILSNYSLISDWLMRSSVLITGRTITSQRSSIRSKKAFLLRTRTVLKQFWL